MRNAVRLLSGALALAALAAAPGPAGAVTLCSGPCPDFDPPGSGTVVVPPPLEIEPLELGLLPPPGSDLEVATSGRVALIFTGSGGVLDADLLELRSRTAIVFPPDVSIDGPALVLCAPDCVDPEDVDTAVSFRLYLPREIGEIRIAALGGITIEAGRPPVIPEPTSAVLGLVGFALVAGRLRRPGARQSTR